MMKAVITSAYGGVNVLSIKEVEKPIINDDEILVKVEASSINPLDWRIRKGEMKMMTGKIPPKILGTDYAGVVSQVGKNIGILHNPPNPIDTSSR
jgi:NADPH:quinone reductase-like Zn-dependent oxidoreductase